MEPDSQRPAEDTKKVKRFLLVKLEERIVPSHLAAVQVAAAPGIEVAQLTQPHVNFQGVKAVPDVIEFGTSSRYGGTNHNEILVRDVVIAGKTRTAMFRRPTSRRCV